MIDCIENCPQCGEEVEMDLPVMDCPGCGATVVACHACQHWEDQDAEACDSCWYGSKFKEVKEDA